MCCPPSGVDGQGRGSLTVFRAAFVTALGYDLTSWSLLDDRTLNDLAFDDGFKRLQCIWQRLDDELHIAQLGVKRRASHDGSKTIGEPTKRSVPGGWRDDVCALRYRKWWGWQWPIIDAVEQCLACVAADLGIVEVRIGRCWSLIVAELRGRYGDDRIDRWPQSAVETLHSLIVADG